jgi:hypothetical protein
VKADAPRTPASAPADGPQPAALVDRYFLDLSASLKRANKRFATARKILADDAATSDMRLVAAAMLDMEPLVKARAKKLRTYTDADAIPTTERMVMGDLFNTVALMRDAISSMWLEHTKA